MHIPIDLALTSENALKDPVIGKGLGALKGGEFVTIVLHLLYHRKKDDSQWSPWLRAIPSLEELPLLINWKEAELHELKGSPVLDAMAVRRNQSPPVSETPPAYPHPIQIVTQGKLAVELRCYNGGHQKGTCPRGALPSQGLGPL